METMINISLERYKELIEIETRIKVIIDILTEQKYISTEDLLRMIGTKEAIEGIGKLKKLEGIGYGKTKM